MRMEACVSELRQFIPKENIFTDEPMANHTSFRIGGPADVFVKVQDEEQLTKALKYLKGDDIPYFVLGNGSNLLVSDAGYRGVILQIGPAMSRVWTEGTLVHAQAGASMHKAAKAAYENGLGGLEFASGIPGTVGGGTVMNAGAYGGEFRDVVETVSVVTADGEKLTLDNEAMQFAYRHSVLLRHPYYVTEVTFRLYPEEQAIIRGKMEDFAARRREKQPLEYPSAGSTFKRPEGFFAGKLIMDAGLRGYTVGGAKVSDKHCGFVINEKNATAEDVRSVIRHVQKSVKERFCVDLETEVLFLGWENDR